MSTPDSCFDLTTLTQIERDAVGDAPSMGALCTVARKRSGYQLKEVAAALGCSHVTVLAWERRSDKRLIAHWRECGFTFPAFIETHIVHIGKTRVVSFDGALKDRGVRAEWSGMTLHRAADDVDPEEHEYLVNERLGEYTFSKELHGLRSVAVSFTRLPVTE